jgi:Integrase zinc binding domain
MRWRLIIEQFGVELRYIKGENKIVADALSRLGLAPSLKSDCDPAVMETPRSRLLAEAFAVDASLSDEFPFQFKNIQLEQQKDQALMTTVRQHPSKYAITNFRGDRTDRKLITRNERIVIPTSLQKRIVWWYHHILCHPGESRPVATIAQHFHWSGMREHVKEE